MLVGVYQDKGRVSDTPESAETVKTKHRLFFSWRIPTNKQTVGTHQHKRFHKDTVSAKNELSETLAGTRLDSHREASVFCVAS